MNARSSDSETLAIEKVEVVAEIVCVPYDYDEYQNAPENADLLVDDVFENGESYQEIIS